MVVFGWALRIRMLRTFEGITNVLVSGLAFEFEEAVV
jgi:hypothetical protein